MPSSQLLFWHHKVAVVGAGVVIVVVVGSCVVVVEVELVAVSHERYAKKPGSSAFSYLQRQFGTQEQVEPTVQEEGPLHTCKTCVPLDKMKLATQTFSEIVAFAQKPPVEFLNVG